MDIYFTERYKWFWERERKKQKELSSPPPVRPNELRLKFDMDVINAVEAKLNENDVLKAYEAIVWDMIITRGLRKD